MEFQRYMDIGVPIKDLGAYPVDALASTILSLPEDAWWGNQFRQHEYEVHQHTQSIVMVFTDGHGWPNIEVSRDCLLYTSPSPRDS